MSELRFIDFFAGIGGMRSGLEQAGHKCLGFCEFDKYATASYTSMYLLNSTQKESLSKLGLKQRQKEILKSEYRNGEWYANDIRAVASRDLPRGANCWCFGAPCQDFSIAGHRAGLSGERSSLIREIFRLLEEQKEENRPEWLIYENVKGMLSSNRGLDYLSILSELDRLGYDIEWQNINSAWFVPQNRERIYTIGHLRKYGSAKVLPIEGTNGENNIYQLGKTKSDKRDNPESGRVYDVRGVSPTLNTVNGGGHEPNVALPCFIDMQTNGGFNLTNKSRAITARQQKGRSNHCDETSAVAILVLTPEMDENRQNCQRMKENGDQSFTFATENRHRAAVGVIDTQGRNGREVSPTDTVPTLRAQTHGNVPEVVEQVDTDDTRHEPMYIQIKNGAMVYAIWYEKYQCYIAIRKLTPRECFRLQGFSDELFDKAQFVNSDSQLYKQSGNAVTVNVAQAIGEKIKST